MKNGTPRTQGKETEVPVLSLIFPGPEKWELWQGPSPEALAPASSAEKPGDLAKNRGEIFCFPGSAFSSLPLWNPVADGIPAREQAALNLEGRGLLGADPGSAVWAVDVIRRQPAGSGEGERELSASAVLHLQLSPDWILEGIRRHEIPGRVLPAPGTGPSVVLRRELGRYVLDLYDRGRWLHSQTLLAREMGEEAVREIGLLLSQMENEGVFQGCTEMVAATPVPAAVWEIFHRLANLRPAQGQGKPAFLLRDPAWDLLPKEVADRRQFQKTQKRIRTMVTWAVGADLALWGLALLFVIVPSLRLGWLEHGLAPLRPEYRRLFQTKKTWEELRSLTDPAGSALEVLHQVAAPLSGDRSKMAIKLTSFTYSPAELVVQGVTAQGEQVIADYLSALSSHPALRDLYAWPPKAHVEGQGQNFLFTITAPSTAPQPEKKEGTQSR